MQHFPIYISLTGERVVVAGGTEAAVAKLRLLMKTEAVLEVYAAQVHAAIRDWAEAGKLRLISRSVEASDLQGARLAYAAFEDEAKDAAFAALARSKGVLVNIVDNLHDSQFITPAIVDRDPVTVAIGTEGAAPVLARAIKADLEERLPYRLGLLARVGKAFRNRADVLPMGRNRRDFWRDYYFGKGERQTAQANPLSIENELEHLLQKHLDAPEREGRVDFVGAGPGDPELLTLKARRLIDEADVILHDSLVPLEILELARREALIIETGKRGYGKSIAQDDIHSLMIEHAADGAQIVRLKGGDPSVFARLDEEIDALDAAGIAWSVTPGITSASAAAASSGASLTRRGRNTGLRLLTAHDTEGFADHDWQALAREGEVTALYMAKKGARFVQGRLLMHGAKPQMPVTIVENASRPDERRIVTDLSNLATDLDTLSLDGPAILLLGLSPRTSSETLTHPTREEIAL
ncbi:siroheme synthase CysG [Qingshengfaniella alkalisoli]|uniref:Uroporphyrinogen-III C-methyltransferase n=1 Tax=Qingshengfaniella alkalisoli TaxID=2599296 RepID=A0A5B8IWQ1_9RHOB|nr:siroheme synthase CysG [Qingshengfaniella alkalisoli]QDY68978.1 uroporphyrinogen-III C-methyltransferase [Qingshengfaniella alkalisoli]